MQRRRNDLNKNKLFYILVAVIVAIIVVLVILIATKNDSNVDIYGEQNLPNQSETNNNTNNANNGNENTNNNDNSNNENVLNEYGVKFEETNDTVYTTIYLNIRKKPSIDGDILYQASPDTKFTRVGIGDNGWDKLKLDSGEYAYASSEYLTTKTSKDGTTGEGRPVAESTGPSVSNTPVDTTHYTGNTLKAGVSESQADAFFKNSVFYGDSVTLGFQNYAAKQGTGFLGGMIVYGTGSYGVANALRAVSSTSIHPTYKGYQTQLWDLTSYLKVDKVFMMFGMNDLGLYGVTDSITNYKTLIDAIREKNPNVKIYILTTTPMTKSYQLQHLNNSNIRLFNNKLRELSSTWDVQVIDVASYLMDSDGYLQENYASDGKYHLTEAAYKEWVKVLRSFASENI